MPKKMHHNKSACRVAFAYWLPLAVTVVIISALVFVAGQQNYRQSANDPQIQVARDIVSVINKGDVSPANLLSTSPTTEMVPSLATFVTVYNATGTPIGSSVSLDGQMPLISESLLIKALKSGETHVTWAPKKGVRIAAVIASYKTTDESGFVVVGRSLEEIDKRINQLAVITAVATALALVLSYLGAWLFAKKMHKEMEKEITQEVQHTEHHA